MFRTSTRAGYVLGVIVVGIPAVGWADDFSVVLEPGVAVPLSAPQSNLYNTGGAQALRALFGVASFLDIGRGQRA
jgi:hypothetical protein